MGVEEKPFLSRTIAASAAGTTDQLRRRERYHRQLERAGSPDRAPDQAPE
jgi:hypothetical protein